MPTIYPIYNQAHSLLACPLYITRPTIYQQINHFLASPLFISMPTIYHQVHYFSAGTLVISRHIGYQQACCISTGSLFITRPTIYFIFLFKIFKLLSLITMTFIHQNISSTIIDQCDTQCSLTSD